MADSATNLTYTTAAVAAYRDRENPLACTSLVAVDHGANSGMTVDVVRTDYSEACRSYRVVRKTEFASLLGSGATGPISSPQNGFFGVLLTLCRPVGLWDLLLIVVAATLALPYMPEGVLDVNGARLPDTEVPLGLQRSISISSSLRVCFLAVSLAVLVVRLWIACTRVHVEEITAIRGIGLQLATYGVFGNVQAKRFLDYRMIRALFIHEGYFRCMAMFYLGATVENQDSVCVFFEDSLPRIAVLRQVLLGLRHVLYGEPEFGLSLAEMEIEMKERESSVDGTSSIGDDEEDDNDDVNIITFHSSGSGKEAPKDRIFFGASVHEDDQSESEHDDVSPLGSRTSAQKHTHDRYMRTSSHRQR